MTMMAKAAMTAPNRTFNAVLAWLLALGLSIGPALALAYGFAWALLSLLGMQNPPMNTLLVVWAPAGLLGGLVWLRPVENFVRRAGYGLDRVEVHHGLEDGQDRTADAVADALTERLNQELGR